MQYTVDWKSEDLMNETESMLVPIGYSVMNRSDHSITFSGQIAPTGGSVLWAGVLGYFDLAAATTYAYAQNTGSQDTTTVLFNSTPDGKTTVTIPDNPSPSNQLLDWWVKNDVLLEPAKEPMVEFEDKNYRILIYNDRIEKFDRAFLFGMRGGYERDADTIRFNEIDSVEVEKKKVFISYRGGETIEIKRQKKEQAEATKVVIDSRKAVIEKYHQNSRQSI